VTALRHAGAHVTTAAMRKTGAAPADRRLKMKDLERATGVGRESIRYYIREGLLPEPERPGRNVAWYDESFVERIRLIKELQQKRFLPLHVIKAVVGGDAPPTPAEVATLGALEGKLLPAGDAAKAGQREPLAALAQRTGLPIEEIRELAAVEAVRINANDGEEWIEGAGIRVVELWSRFRAAGFTADRGFGANEARLYVDMVRLMAREELRLFTRGLAGTVNDDELVRMATAGIQIGTEMVAILHHQALLAFVADVARPSEPTRS
jgi:DNA-binding transcriptional MerR regulator